MIDKILGIVKDLGIKSLQTLISAIKTISVYLLLKQQKSDEKQLKKEEKAKNDEIDDVCDNGSVSDLIDLCKKSFKSVVFIVSITCICGCATTEPEIMATKQWENHYKSTKDFYKGTENIKLEKGESIWVLSNSTLSRMIKDLKNNNNK